MTHEEEELQHAISKLWDQVQQISLSQRESKDGLKGDMDGLKVEIKGDMNVLKVDMEGLKEGLTNLLQEMLPSSEKVFHETHKEKKRNMNYDFRVPNVGFKTHHIPHIDMSKFDGKDPITWILQVEQYLISMMCNTHKRYTLHLYI